MQELGGSEEPTSGITAAGSDAEYSILARAIRAQPVGGVAGDNLVSSSSSSGASRPQTAALDARASMLGGGVSRVGLGASAGAGSSSALARPMTAAGCGRADSALAVALERRHESAVDSSAAGSGSSLTHGSDVVFAGSAVRALQQRLHGHQRDAAATQSKHSTRQGCQWASCERAPGEHGAECSGSRRSDHCIQL